MGSTTRRCWGYVRVSTHEQATEGLSVEVQRRQIEAWAALKGLRVTRTFVERGVSGARALNERPAGAELLAQLQPYDTIICAKLDRMFRSAANALSILEQFKKLKCSLHLIDLGGDVCGDGIAKLFFTIVAAFAEAERDRTRERIKDVKRDQRQQGRFLGGSLPFGFRLRGKGKLVEHPAEQRAIKRMRQLRRQGQSYRAIAAATRARGFSISHAAVRNALRQP